MNSISNFPYRRWTDCLRSFSLAPICALGILITPAQAGTLVSVQSNIGEFKLELLDDEVPGTVAQFLANIEAGNYQFTMVHAASSTLFAGGLFFYNSCSEGPVPAPALPKVPVESSSRPNSSRTIAMVPNSDDPTTLGSQWIINLGDNDSFFDPALRPIVFGEIVEGYAVADAVVDLWRVSMNISPSVPTINYEGNLVVECGFFGRDNVLKMSMQVESEEAVNSFDPNSGLLTISVDAGSAGLLQLSLLLQTTSPTPILQVQPETVTTLPAPVDGMASYNAETGELSIPSLTIDDEIAYRNMVFSLTDADTLVFTLLSAETP